MFNEVHKDFGFGCMRLPMKDDAVDYAEFNKMIDAFIESGFNYFDTAHGYLQGKSETALHDCLVKRYPRDKYMLTDKLTDFFFKTEADVLDEILTEYPQIEAVQIQLNYLDYDDPAIQSRKCLEICNKHNKPVIVMEPVKGGNLVNLPEGAKRHFEALGSASAASYAVRFAAGCDGVFMVLSGMSDLAQMNDNLSYMKEFKPLDEREMLAVAEVCAAIKGLNLIPCTACRYCTDGCPKKISIPDLFACMNTKNIYHDWNANYYYEQVHTKNGGKASECVSCGKCEKACPQHLPIRNLLKDVAKEFEK